LPGSALPVLISNVGTEVRIRVRVIRVRVNKAAKRRNYSIAAHNRIFTTDQLKA